MGFTIKDNVIMNSGEGSIEQTLGKSTQVGEKKTGLVASVARPVFMLSIACGLVFWAYRVVSDSQNPLGAAARRLHGGTVESRLEAVQEVTEMGLARGKESIPPLVESLADLDAPVRSASARSLGLVVSYAVRVQAGADSVQGATAALMSAMKDQDAKVRVEAARALAMITATAPGGGKRGGGKKAVNIGKSAAEAGIDVKSLASAYKDMLSESDESLRVIGIEGLGAVGPALDSPPDPALVAALDDHQSTARIAALNALGRYAKGLDPVVPKLVNMLKNDPAEDVKLNCASTIGRLPASSLTAAAVGPLVAAMKSAGKDASFSILTLLAGLNDEARRAAIPAFLEGLKAPASEDLPVGAGSPTLNSFTGPAQVSARALSRTAPGTPQSGEVVTALANVLKSTLPSRWPAAADALAAFGPAAAPAVPALIDTLKQAATKEDIANAAAASAKALAVVAVGAPTLPEAVDALKAATKSSNASVRQAAEKALEKLDPKTPVKKTS